MSDSNGPLLSHEAAYLRAALLLGLVHEPDVAEWAQVRLARLDASVPAAALLTDVLLAEEALSPMREALRPLEGGVDSAQLTDTLLAGIAVDDALAERSVADRLRVLGLLRREFHLPRGVVDAINGFIERAMLADANIDAARAPRGSELQQWLDAVRPPAVFRFEFDYPDEGASFLAAVSRKHVRDRTWESPGEPTGAAWVAADDSGTVILLNERSWRLAVREFSPLPIASRIPALSLPSHAVPVLDERTSEALGVDDAAEMLRSVREPLSRDATRTGEGAR